MEEFWGGKTGGNNDSHYPHLIQLLEEFTLVEVCRVIVALVASLNE